MNLRTVRIGAHILSLIPTTLLGARGRHLFHINLGTGYMRTVCVWPWPRRAQPWMGP